MLKLIINSINRLLHVILALFLSAMAILVFSNVILRYVFSASLPWSDEAARYLYIWVIFIGGLIAYQENSHLGVDVLVKILPVIGRKIFFAINNLIVLAVLCLIVVGAWEYMSVTNGVRSPALNLPLSFVYSSGFIACFGMAVIALHNLWRLITGRLNENDLVMISGSEEDQKVEQAVSGGSKKGDDTI